MSICAQSIPGISCSRVGEVTVTFTFELWPPNLILESKWMVLPNSCQTPAKSSWDIASTRTGQTYGRMDKPKTRLTLVWRHEKKKQSIISLCLFTLKLLTNLPPAGSGSCRVFHWLHKLNVRNTNSPNYRMCVYKHKQKERCVVNYEERCVLTTPGLKNQSCWKELQWLSSQRKTMRHIDIWSSAQFPTQTGSIWHRARTEATSTVRTQSDGIRDSVTKSKLQ